MLKTIIKVLPSLIVTFFLVTCDKYEFPKSPYPRIETLPVVNISETGVTFQANIIQLGESEITNHGFVWGLDENLAIGSEDKVQLGAKPGLGKFEADVKSGLTEGDVYFVRAFAATQDYLVYGEAVSFTSKGSTPPIIRSFSPLEGTGGDTITIKGHYFSGLAKANVIKFGSVQSTVLTSTDSTIQCIVPNLNANQSYSISVNVTGNSTTSEINFHVLQPRIESMTPLKGIFGDIITINGKNFPIKKDYITITLDGIICEVSSVTRSAIRFVLPNSLIRSNNQVVAKISMVNVNVGELKILPPTIGSVTNSVLTMYTNPALVISGNNFNPVITKNEVYIGGYSCNILSSSLTQLTIQAPRQLIPFVDLSVRDTFDIIVKVLDQSVTIENRIAVSFFSRWTRMKDFPGNPRILGLSFSANGKGYVGLGSAEEFSTWYNDMWEYDPTTDTWTQMGDFPGRPRAKFVTLVINSKTYIVGGITGHGSNGISDVSKEVWAFDSNTKNWERKSDFPGDINASAFGFVIDNTGFLGYRNHQPISEGEFWKYSSSTDSWTQLSNIPDSIIAGEIFGISNGTDGYILSGLGGYVRPFWKYDKTNDTWIDIPDFPEYIQQVTGFHLKGKYYIGTGRTSNWPGTQSFYAFNSVTNTWTREDFRGSPRRTVSSFVLGNYGYLLFGQGECHCANLNDVWRFDPSKP